MAQSQLLGFGREGKGRAGLGVEADKVFLVSNTSLLLIIAGFFCP